MNILVIKQTSLGDVLHATGHIRSIKQHFSGCHLTLLTATTSKAIYENSPWVDEIIDVDRYGVKHNWYMRPVWTWQEMRRAMSRVRQKSYDLAIDLQGLARSVVFLYGAESKRKIVKGHWPGLEGFRDRNLHAIREMDKVLELAGIALNDTSMEFIPRQKEKTSVRRLLAALNPEGKDILIMSPFSRWQSKDWGFGNYLRTCDRISEKFLVLITGTEDCKSMVNEEIDAHHFGKDGSKPINLCGRLTLGEFAELTAKAELMLAGDSFPMHLAGAMGTPVIALFGPTDETKVGPLGETDRVLRAAGCDKCDDKACPRRCLDRLPVPDVVDAIRDTEH